MREIWDTEGQIDFFSAWAFQEGCVDFSLDAAASTSVFRNEDWWRDFRRRGEPYRYDPLHGGTNALHLGHSDFGSDTDVDVPPAALHMDQTTRQAVLVTRDFMTWREEIATASRRLPLLPNQRSWHVDVFDKRVGWLGTYRRSRVTGHWFAGTHSLHMTGQ
jgi:hypothetical protein